MGDLERKVNEIELELIVAEEELSYERRGDKELIGKVNGLRKALHILTGKSYDPKDYVNDEDEEIEE